MYKQFLEDDRKSNGDMSLVRLTGESRQQAVSNVTECILQGIQSSASSDRARVALVRCTSRVENIVNDGVAQMFRMVESQSTSANSRLSCECPYPPNLKGITKRGMAQPRAKKK